VSRYQKGKINLDLTGARDSKWQWHQLGHMQTCTLLQTDNYASTPSLSFSGRMPFLPPNQQRQSTEGNMQLKTGTTLRHIKCILIVALQSLVHGSPWPCRGRDAFGG